MKDPLKEALQEQLIAGRRSQILDAATRVFATKGFHPTTIKDIAREAGVADGTIYNYFTNKTALLLGILDRLNETDQRATDFSQLTDISQVSKGEFRSFMMAYIAHRMLIFKADEFRIFKVLISEIMVNQELREQYRQKIVEPTMKMAEVYFQQWAEKRVLRPTNVRLTIRAISGLILGLMVEYVMGDETLEEEWETLPAFITDLILDGLRSTQA
ncbi:TetR/AcrR family transcriptional regulator [Ktedonospora formicarum]|uniref:TetR family transcriptional regulator n=1 Tax=Ktedonospora formicarum TaxID=2778364 RepID=A0A8J3MX30_9CHLR|nr:TetR/AcrR family transcriptional regulator [Ktedonospora formicarum]GHO48155.1 TetR family transcriptional regulator [Ktedonospora formicarum]